MEFNLRVREWEVSTSSTFQNLNIPLRCRKTIPLLSGYALQQIPVFPQDGIDLLSDNQCLSSIFTMFQRIHFATLFSFWCFYSRPFPRLPFVDHLCLSCPSLWCPAVCHHPPPIIRFPGSSFLRARAFAP